MFSKTTHAFPLMIRDHLLDTERSFGCATSQLGGYGMVTSADVAASAIFLKKVRTGLTFCFTRPL